MSICYAIKDWDKHFENSESRKIKSLTWVPVKNKHDGKGYRRVCQHPKSAKVFCAWNLIIQVASKMPVRGLLCDDDGPLTTSDLASKTGYPEHVFAVALEVLKDAKIGWLKQVEVRRSTLGNWEVIPAAPETSGNVGIEQKGTEGNGMEQKDKNISLSYKLSSGGSKGGAHAARAPGGTGGMKNPLPPEVLLTVSGLTPVVIHILGNVDGWEYDNSKVKVADFTPGGLKTVLLPYIDKVTVGQAQTAFTEAAAETHKAAVDGMAKNPGAYCTAVFKAKLNEAMSAKTPTS